MQARWRADRLHLRTLLTTQPDWILDDLAAATSRSRSRVKKWERRLRAAPDDEMVLHSLSRARKHPPPALSQIVIDRILGKCEYVLGQDRMLVAARLAADVLGVPTILVARTNRHDCLTPCLRCCAFPEPSGATR